MPVLQQLVQKAPVTVRKKLLSKLNIGNVGTPKEKKALKKPLSR